MKRYLITLLSVLVAFGAMAQKNVSKGKMEVYKRGEGYYYESIMKDVNAVDEKLTEQEPYKRFVMDQSGLDLPNDPSLYTTAWCQPTLSQGNTGTCWCFSTSSLYESEVYRQTGKKVKLSEIYTVYWEYVEKARRFIEKRGDSNFDEGSEGNAVRRIMKMYGAVPESEYTGLLDGRKFHSHAKMMEEMR
ncbi:MAG TPA: C1 family peptidase, partial [Draconibacterium sp.]|nr:C1 family peptidase [Draconibacterium sp.]